MKTADPQQEHQWLQKLVGEWTYEFEPSPQEKPGQKVTGTETIRSLGALWIVAEGNGQSPGGEPTTSMMTLGYDPARKSYIGTWIGSMMTHMWIYNGSLNDAGTVLTLDTDGPHMSKPGETAKYRDIITVEDENTRTLTAEVQQDDGSWQNMMVCKYVRTGKARSQGADR